MLNRYTAVYGDALPEIKYFHSQLVEGDGLTADIDFGIRGDKGTEYGITPKNVGTYLVNFKRVCINGEEVPVSYEGEKYYNYYIAVVAGSLEITLRDITVELTPIADVLYGETFAYADKIGNYANAPDLAYNEQLKIAVKYLNGNGNIVSPKNAGVYSAAIDLDNCILYNADGTEFDGGLTNYNIICAALENLKIGKHALCFKPLSFTSENGNAVIYGEFEKFTYPAGIGNYESVFIDTSTPFYHPVPYNEQFEIVKIKYYVGNYDYSPKNVGAYEIMADLASVVVYDEDGNVIENGINNYNIKKGNVSSDFEIVAREFTVELEDMLDVPYGDILTKVNYSTEIGNYKAVYTTAYGEQLKFSVTYQKDGVDVTPKNVGEYDIVPYGFTVYDKDGNKIEGGEKNYVRTGYTAGTLEIVPREIGVTFEYPERVYGEEIPTEITLTGIYSLSFTNLGVGMTPTVLPYGDTLSFEFAYGRLEDNDCSSQWFGDPGYGIKNPVTPRNAGCYVMIVTDIFVNGEICVNYRVFLEIPILSINEREITVELNGVDDVTYGDTFVYGVNASGLTYANSPDFAYNEQLTVAVKFIDGNGNVIDPKNAGVYSAEIDLDNCVVLDENGNVIEGGINNYLVSSAKLENLKINKKSLFIKIEDLGKIGEIVYGDALPQNTFTIYSSIACDNKIENGDLPYNETLGFVFRYLLNGEVVSPKNAGEYSITVDLSNVKNIIIDGVPCENENYDINLTDGKLAIAKKTLDITLTDEFTLIYGEAEHVGIYGWLNDLVSNPYFATVDGGDISLAYGEQLNIAVKYYDKNGNEVTPKDSGEYVMRADFFFIEPEGNADGETGFGELTNYIINCNDGKLTINRKKITVVFDDKECVYGDSLPAITAQITEGLDENGKFPYGEDYIIEGYYVDGFGSMLSQPDAGTYAIKFDCLFDREQLIEAGDNYDVTAVSGTLTVKQRGVCITIGNLSATYGEKIGEPDYKVELLGSDGEVIGNKLPYYERLSLRFAFTPGGAITVNPVNAGTYTIYCANIEVLGGSLSNYNITEVSGKLTISPKQITVEIYSDSCVYGEEIPHNKFVICDGLDENGKLPYGENIDFVYSYEKDGVSTRTPKAAGVYTVSVAGVNVDNGGSDGNYRIGYIGSPVLEIKTKQITVALNGGVAPAPFAYGDNFEASISNAKVEGLLDGQILKAAVKYSQVTQTVGRRTANTFAVAFNARDGFTPRNVGAYIAELDWDNCLLFESDGVTPVEGVMDNYAFASGNECSPVTFTIVKKQITVTISNSSGIYGDGLPLGQIGYALSEELPYGEELLLTFAITDGDGKAAKNVGVYDITVVGKDIDGGSIDNYDIIVADNAPKHEITARKINVTLTNQFVTFGDTPAYPDTIGNYDGIDNLADGESLRVTVKYTLNGVTVANPAQAGIYEIEVASFEVYGANDELITDGFKNYEIVSVTGTLEISSRVITVKSGDAEKEYDGEALTSGEYEILSGALADGYTIAVKEYFKQVHATGEDGVENKTTFAVMFNGKETDNYVISCTQYGRFVVTPRAITIVTDSAERDYNGEALTAGYTLSYNGEGEEKPLGEGDTISIVSTNSITDAGSVKNSITYIITNAKNEDVTATDYAITYTEGTLTVNALSVKVTISNVSAQYGEKFEVPFTLDCGSLPNGEQLAFEVVYKTRTGAVTPEISDDWFILARGSYVIEADESTATVDGKAEKVANYDFDFGNTGTLTVSRREIIVTTVTASKTYDGDPLTNGRYDTVWAKDAGYEGLVGSDGLEYSGELPSVTECGVTVENRILYAASDNYTIVERKYGTLSIVQRAITIQTGDIIGEYDGNPYSNDTGLVVGGVALVDGHELVAVDVYERTEATEDGSEKNTTTFKVMNGSTDVTENYNIGYENGSVIISRRAITVRTADISATYDGKAHYDGNFDWVGTARPVLDHQLVVAQLFTWTNATVSDSKQNTTTYSVKGADGDMTANYNITVLPGSVDIAPA
ncbi:MAG: hypothetical protein K2L72_03810, partial [Clostridia bacterium]|nr:hypothetical protein [Clostridia bacterium]